MIKKFGDCENNLQCKFIIGEVDGHIEEKNGINT